MSQLGINLHDIVHGAIGTLHPHEDITLYQSKGSQNNKGTIQPVFFNAGVVDAQIQSEGADTLEPMRESNATSQVRKCYLYSVTTADVVPQGLVRVDKRGGDFIQREDGSWWLVVAMLEDFSRSGWVCVRVQQQLKLPENALILETDPDPTPDPEPDP